MNASAVRGLYVNFYFDSSNVSVFVDAHGSRVEDTIDVMFYGNKLLPLPTNALYITAPNTVNTDIISL